MSAVTIQRTITTTVPAGLMSRSLAAKFLGVCEKTIDNLVNRGSLTPVRFSRRVMFRREDLEAFVNASLAPKPVSRPAEASASKGG